MAARPPTDVFRPCLPLDPFAALDPGPWHPSIHPNADPPSAVLVLGEPPLSDLHPILFSPSLARSLIVLATHAPPYIPQKPFPSVRILRLSSPLAQDSGALRLVSLLEKADRVVRLFRTCDTEWPRKLVQLAENSATGEFDVEEPYSPSTPPSSPSDLLSQQDVIRRYPSPAPSAASSISSSSIRSASSSSFSIRSSSSNYLSRRRRASQLRLSSKPAVDRAFDAIINFLPNTAPDKLLLKHAILVSTLTASFFAAPPAPLTRPPTSYPLSKPKRRLSIFSNRSSSHVGVVADHAKEPRANPTGTTAAAASVAAAKKNPRRFSTILRRQHQNTTTANANELVHSAPCSRDSLPLTSGVGHAKGKFRSTSSPNHHHPTTESQRNPHLIHILPSHVYNPSTTSAAASSSSNAGAMGATGSNGRRSNRRTPLGHQRQYPNAKPKLVQSIEQFLLAYGYPLQSMSALSSPTSATPSAPSSRRVSAASTISMSHMSASFSFGDAAGQQQQKSIPFLLPAGVFGSVPAGGRLTIGEILLMGGLDGQEGREEEMVVSGMGGFPTGIEGRVWIASADDVVWGDPDLASNLSIGNQAKPPYIVDSPELRGPQPRSMNSFSSSPPNASKSAPSSISLSSSPLSAFPVKSRAAIPVLHQPSPPPAPRSSALNPRPTVTYAPAPATISVAIPPKPRKIVKRASSSSPTSPVDGRKSGKGQPREREVQQQQQLPTPPESSSSLEDEADATTPYGIARSVSSSGSNSACASDMTHARTPSWNKFKTNSDAGHTMASVGSQRSSKRGHYMTTSVVAAAAKFTKTRPDAKEKENELMKAMKQKRRSSLGRVLAGLGKLVGGGGS